MMKIDGNTKLTGIIGYPIEHTLSPVFQNAAFEKVGLNWAYLPFLVSPGRLGEAIAGLKVLNFIGINVTMPHKKEVIKYLDELSPAARIAGVANTILFKKNILVGYNTDGQGFVESLRKDARFSPRGKNVILIGAGGAAKSIAVSLALAGIKRLIIINRTPTRAQRLQRLISDNFPHCLVKVLPENDEKIVSLKSESHLIVNATSVGMLSNPGLPMGTEGIGRKHLVYDVIYEPAETQFLIDAKKRGAKTLNGAYMLLYQGVASWQIWTGQSAPIAAMAAALKMERELKGVKINGKSKPTARKNSDRL